MLRWGKQRHSAFAFQAEIDQLLSLNINTFCYTVTLEEIAMMISEIDSDGNAHIDLNVWFGCNINVNLDGGPPSSVIKWTSKILDERPMEEASEFFFCCCCRIATIAWFIWKSRNEFIFNAVPINPEATLRRANGAFGEFSGILDSNQVHRDNLQTGASSAQRKAPDHGKLKFNCDAVVSKDGRRAKVVVVLSDWRVNLVHGNVECAFISSPLQGELLAICLACGMVTDLKLNKVEIESDNQLAVKLSGSELVPPWEVMAVVLDVRQFCRDLGLTVSWINREPGS